MGDTPEHPDQTLPAAAPPDPAPESEAAAPSFDPEQSEGTSFELSPRALALWFWQTAMTLVPFSIAPVVIAALSGRWWLVPVALVVLGMLLVLTHRYNQAWIARFRCVLLPDGLLIRRGLLFRNEIFIPRARIQHTDVSEGPIARHFGIAAVKVFTAGTQVASLGVDGLPRESAIDLRDRLLGRHGHDAV